MIEGFFPDSQQVRRLGLENSNDKEIWNYAKSKGFTILTFDADFADLANIYGSPPKIIWLRTGNLSTHVARIINEPQRLIFSFCNEKNYKNIDCLEIE